MTLGLGVTLVTDASWQVVARNKYVHDHDYVRPTYFCVCHSIGSEFLLWLISMEHSHYSGYEIHPGLDTTKRHMEIDHISV